MNNIDLDAKIGKWFWENREHRIRLAVLEGLGGTIVYILLPPLYSGVTRYIDIAICYIFISSIMYWGNQKLLKKHRED